MSECQMAELLELLSDRVTMQSEILDRQSRLLAGMERRLRTLEALAARGAIVPLGPETLQ